MVVGVVAMGVVVAPEGPALVAVAEVPAEYLATGATGDAEDGAIVILMGVHLR